MAFCIFPITQIEAFIGTLHFLPKNFGEFRRKLEKTRAVDFYTTAVKPHQNRPSKRRILAGYQIIDFTLLSQPVPMLKMIFFLFSMMWAISSFVQYPFQITKM